jgi:two-component system LytT family response regulator
LRASVERVRKVLGRPAEIAASIDKIASAQPVNAPWSRKVVGRSGEEYFLLDTDDVLVFQADGGFVWIVTAKQRFVATQTLRAITEHLKEPQFYRIRRNAIVNANHIRKMAAMSSQRWLITLSNGLQLTGSKRMARKIRAILHW